MDSLAVHAAQDEEARARLMLSCERFILKTAFRCVRRYVSKSDDEWSIALIAFSQAIDTFNPEKGGFFAYAELLMRSRLTDYCRSQAKYAVELDVAPTVFTGDVEQEEADSPLQAVVLRRTATQESTAIKDEIQAANDLFRRYGFSFFDLAECSPKSTKTKKLCAQAVLFLINHPPLWQEAQESLQLPLKTLTMRTAIPRKLLERHRKYIIAASEILLGDFPCLSEYMRFIREEGGR